MKRMTILLVLVLLALAALAGCTAANPEPGEDAGAGEDNGALVDSHDELRAALEAAGLTVEQDDVLLDTFFPETTARYLQVNGAMIQTFEFADVAAAEAGAATVNATGTIIGNATIDWADRPHFYQQGGLIVLYAGEDEAILGALEGALGEPFVIGESSFAPEPADE